MLALQCIQVPAAPPLPVSSPSPNFDDIPTINVSTFEVPLPAYWRILDLLAEGRAEDEIVKAVMRHTGTKTLHVVTAIVDSVAENQRLIVVEERAKPSPSSPTTRTRPSSRLSMATAWKKQPRQVSEYRAARMEARRDLQAAEDQLKSAKQTEKKLLNDALVLAQRNESLTSQKMSFDQRRRTMSAIDQQMKHVLRKHHDVEAEIKFAKRLTVIHKASLA